MFIISGLFYVYYRRGQRVTSVVSIDYEITQKKKRSGASTDRDILAPKLILNKNVKKG